MTGGQYRAAGVFSICEPRPRGSGFFCLRDSAMVWQIHPTDVKAKLDAGEPVLLLDVRQPEEYASAGSPAAL